jgi:hypothetical protein
MAARKDNKKRLEQRQAEQERARQKQASKQAAAAQAQRAAQQEEMQRLQRQAAAQDPAARAAAQKRYVEMVNAAPEYQRSLLDLTVPPSLRTAQAAGRYLFTKSADLLGVGIYVASSAKAATNSHFVDNATVCSDIDFVLSKVPRNEYAYISYERVDGVDFGTGPDGTPLALPIYNPDSVHINKVIPLGDPGRLGVIMMRGEGPVPNQPKPPKEYDPSGLQDLVETLKANLGARKNGLDPITPQLEKQINDELDRRRKARHASGSQQSENPDEDNSDPIQLADLVDAPAPEAPVFADVPAEPADQGDPGGVAIASVRALRVNDKAELTLRSVIDEVAARGHQPPPPPAHPEWGLPSVARALSQVEAKLRKAAKDDSDVRSQGPRTILALLAEADPEMRPLLHRARWLVDDDAYVDMLCCGHWRSSPERAQLGDVVSIAEPAVPGGLRVGIALSNDVGQWLTTDSYGRFRILPPSAGAVVVRAWQPVPRAPFNPEGQLGAVWTPKRWRAMLEGCYANNAATSDDLLGHVCDATGLRGLDTALALSRQVVGELRSVSSGAPLWPGAVVFGREAGDFGVLLPDGQVVGTCSAAEYPDQVGYLRVQRFQPRFVWYPHLP